MLRKVFPHWQNQSDPVAYWRCKYPVDKTRTFVAEADGKIVGSVSYVKCLIKIGDDSHVATLGDDLATHPDYRGLGVTKSYAEARDVWDKEIGLDLSYVITTNQIVVDSARRVNAKELPCSINHLIRIKDINLYLSKRNMNHTLLSPGLSLLRSVSNIGVKPIDPRRDFEVVEKPIDGSFKYFWEEARTQFDFVVEKNLDQLSWRYQPGLGDYKILQCLNGDELLGYIVLENKRVDDYFEGYVTDIITLPGRSDVSIALMNEALHYFDKESVNAVHVRGVKGGITEKTAKLMGFMTPPRAIDMYVILYYKDSRMHEPLINARPDKLYFSYGDYL